MVTAVVIDGQRHFPMGRGRRGIHARKGVVQQKGCPWFHYEISEGTTPGSSGKLTIPRVRPAGRTPLDRRMAFGQAFASRGTRPPPKGRAPSGREKVQGSAPRGAHPWIAVWFLVKLLLPEGRAPPKGRAPSRREKVQCGCFGLRLFASPCNKWIPLRPPLRRWCCPASTC